MFWNRHALITSRFNPGGPFIGTLLGCCRGGCGASGARLRTELITGSGYVSRINVCLSSIWTDPRFGDLCCEYRFNGMRLSTLFSGKLWENPVAVELFLEVAFCGVSLFPVSLTFGTTLLCILF